MSHFLIIVSIGPVQGFIASARRTRDLWYGSDLLARLASEADACIAKRGGKVVIPGIKAAHATNKLVAVVPAADAGAISDLEQAVQQRLAEFLDDEGKACRAAVDATVARTADAARRRENEDTEAADIVDWDRFDRQLSELLELTLVAVPLAGSDATSYREAYQCAEQALAARKATRLFKQTTVDSNASSGLGISKSSLDGAREGVLLRQAFSASVVARRFRQRFGVDVNEQLDAPGLLKRVLGRNERFAALTALVAAPWLRWARNIDEAGVTALLAAYEGLVAAGLATRSPHPDCPFDGELLLLGRASLDLAQAETPDAHSNLSTFSAAADHVSQSIARQKDLREWVAPQPYVALIQLDGDHLGEALWNGDRETHKRIAAALQGFAGHVKSLCEVNSRAQAIYVGGDDALVVCALDDALPLCRELYDAFTQDVTNVISASVTLSVGVAVGHVLTPMANLRLAAADALTLAKRGFADDMPAARRDALAITIQPRSGVRLVARGKWGDGASEPPQSGLDQRILKYADRFESDIYPDALATLMAKAVDEYGVHARLLRAAVGRALQRRDVADRVRDEILDDFEVRRASVSVTEASTEFNRELGVARWLARHRYPTLATLDGARERAQS